MKPWARHFTLAFAALGIAAGAYFVTAREAAAPQVRFVTLQGEAITTADLRGKVVLVNFWATDCIPCAKEMPRMAETFRKFSVRGFETIAVAMSYDPPNYVLNYTEKNALPYKVALDVAGTIARSFGDVRYTPTTFLIDRRGNIVRRILGEADFGELDALIERELKRPA